ncbi:MAG: SDR family NAD(P)-dependent oxidoreductase [Actinomycetia bacterium]|nr:SDR family NAD(P)-dependent oxidoreductase [Actinomycetes bacterium]
MSQIHPDGWRKVADTALEYSIVGSFTKLGLQARRGMFGWESESTPDLAGREILITGATSGLGLAAAHQLAAMGARVVLVGRNPSKTAAATEAVRQSSPSHEASFLTADMAEPGQVTQLIADVIEHHSDLDTVIQNAGALSAEYTMNSQGMEMTVASQVLGQFQLTAGLLPLLRKRASARVITVSSGGMYSEPLSLRRLVMRPDDYDGTVAYARAKRAQVALNIAWAQHEVNSHIDFLAMHPGWADTPGVVTSLPTFHKVMGPLLRTPEQGADTIAWLAASPTPQGMSGQFWHDRAPRGTAYLPKTKMAPAQIDELWDWCEEQVAAAVTEAETAGEVSGAKA